MHSGGRGKFFSPLLPDSNLLKDLGVFHLPNSNCLLEDYSFFIYGRGLSINYVYWEEGGGVLCVKREGGGGEDADISWQTNYEV